MPLARVLAGCALLVTMTGGCSPFEERPGQQSALSSELPGPVDGLVDGLRRFWGEQLPQGGQDLPRVVLATGAVSSGCDSEVDEGQEGSFFCGEDRTVYVDRADLDELAQGGGLDAPAVVHLVAHEYGHAVQERLGLEQDETGKGPAGASVRYELQADCLAGVAVAELDKRPLLAFVPAVRATGDDVGDDPLPAAEFEHGSGAQRIAAFTRGFERGVDGCGLS